MCCYCMGERMHAEKPSWIASMLVAGKLTHVQLCAVRVSNKPTPLLYVGQSREGYQKNSPKENVLSAPGEMRTREKQQGNITEHSRAFMAQETTGDLQKSDC